MEAQQIILDSARQAYEDQQLVVRDIRRAYEDQNAAAEAVGTTIGANTALANLRLAAEREITAEMEKQAGKVAAKAASQQAEQIAAMGPQSAAFGAGFAGGGTVARGGVARVGERGAETVLLPAGAQVVAAGVRGATSIDNRQSHSWSINGVSQPIDVADAVKRMLAFDRLRRGRG